MSTIHGIGVDIVEVDRISHAVTRWGNRFLTRVFTPRELVYCQGKPFPSQHLAARFAAKEAVMKAVGTGLNGAVGFRGIEIARGNSGPPEVLLDNGILRTLPRHVRVTVSLSHTRTLATAFAIAAVEDPHTPFSHQEKRHDQVY